MFTGIIQAVATIAPLRDQDGLRTFTMEFPEGFCQDLAIGASVSHDGVCLTVTENLSPPAPPSMMLQSLNITTLGSYQVGDAINGARSQGWSRDWRPPAVGPRGLHRAAAGDCEDRHQPQDPLWHPEAFRPMCLPRAISPLTVPA
ncbi:hypothetical protein J4711_14225 [Staphylococcus epidermidis]|nr:hypothetical protein [Staphylococcus epidermidis]